jgi:hypothetical protein
MIADKKDSLLRIDNLTVHYGAAQALFGFCHIGIMVILCFIKPKRGF